MRYKNHLRSWKITWWPCSKTKTQCEPLILHHQAYPCSEVPLPLLGNRAAEVIWVKRVQTEGNAGAGNNGWVSGRRFGFTWNPIAWVHLIASRGESPANGRPHQLRRVSQSVGRSVSMLLGCLDRRRRVRGSCSSPAPEHESTSRIFPRRRIIPLPVPASRFHSLTPAGHDISAGEPSASSAFLLSPSFFQFYTSWFYYNSSNADVWRWSIHSCGGDDSETPSGVNYGWMQTIRL